MGIKLISAPAELRILTGDLRAKGLKIGFVPTMGALHDGHGQLLRLSKRETDFTILSIFVNQAQFNNLNDYATYPKTFEADFELAEALAVDVIFAPQSQEALFPENYQYRVTETNFSKKLCGAHRPGHFDGVLTVVLKLLHLTQCHNAYFGEKDFQQLTLIKGMVEALFLPTKIIEVTTVRESSGLAMSSRNQKLSAEGKALASQVYSSLLRDLNLNECRAYIQKLGIEIEYLEDYRNRRFIAFYVEGVRLIDNVEI